MRFDTRTPRRCAIRGPISALLLLLALIAAPAQAEWLQGEQAIMGTRCVVELEHGSVAARPRSMRSHRVPAHRRAHEHLQAGERAVARQRDRGNGSRASVARTLRPARNVDRVFELTGGAFDVTYASVGYLYDYRARASRRRGYRGRSTGHRLPPHRAGPGNAFRAPAARRSHRPRGIAKDTRSIGASRCSRRSESTARWSTPAATRASSATASGARGS